MVEQSTQGSFTPQGRQDILATAIGTPEHPGRVRAAGRGVGIRQFFGPPSSSSCSKPHMSEVDFESLKDQLREEIRREVYSNLKAELLSDMRAELASMSAQPSVAPTEPSPIRVSTRGSCGPLDTSAEVAPATAADCELYIAGPPERLVALGNFLSNYIVLR